MSHTVQITCFLEDIAQERFIIALIRRAANEEGIQVQLEVRNATHGSRVWLEFAQFLQDLKRGSQPMPDVLLVAIDGNCQKVAHVRQHIDQEIERSEVSVPYTVCAVPNPHIERWYLEDQRALAQVLPGAQSSKLRYKCERDRYKKALREAIRKAGVEPLLGGAEYGEEIANALDPEQMNKSFKKFWDDLKRALKSCI